jgi:hypothetical protein
MTPDLDAGMALVFRRKTAAAVVPETRCFTACLRGLDPDVQCEVTQLSSEVHASPPGVFGGRALAKEGLKLEIPAAPGAMLITYRRA